jgi:hypothetical protein
MHILQEFLIFDLIVMNFSTIIAKKPRPTAAFHCKSLLMKRARKNIFINFWKNRQKMLKKNADKMLD